MRKVFQTIALVVSFSLLTVTTTVAKQPQTLKTKNFTIKITENCPEGEVACDQVNYYGVSVKDGKTIQLIGRTLHSEGAGGAPGRFLGYEFNNGEYRYIISDDGMLQIYKGQQLLQQEQGTWQGN